MKKPDDDDITLFRDSIGTVKPVPDDRVLRARRNISPRPVFRDMDEAEVLRDLLSEQFDAYDLETGEELIYVRPGLQHRTVKKLRRGRIVIDAEIDLHGMTVPVARAAISAFLHDCQRRRVQCARIVHGKGHGSHHRTPVLKGKVGGWLRQRDEVLAYCSAPNFDGGTGAIYVLLKRRH
ncbi:MAG: Smr/MutS family protein [Thiogranum sp.]|nr:Smr/MutS family protein [Thiogranum sp.]